MGIVVRQSVKSVIITLLGVLMGALVTVLSTRFFPKAELGFRESLIKISIQVSQLALFGFNYTLLVYGQRYPPGHKERGTFLTVTLVVPLIISLLVCASYFLLRNYIGYFYEGEDAVMIRRYLVLFPLLTFLSTAMAWLEGYLQSLHKTALQNLAREVLARIIYITLIILFACGVISFHVFIWLYVVLYLVPFFFLLYIAMRTPGFRFEFRKEYCTGIFLKDIMQFAGYHTLTMVSSMLLLQLDAILLGPLDANGFEAVAVYSVATLAVSMVRNPARALSLASLPALTQSYNEGNLPGLRDLFRRSSVNMQVMGLGMFALIYINIDNVQEVMAMIKPGYDQIRYLIMILMIGQLADMVSGLNFELLTISQYYRFTFWLSLGLLAVVFVLNFFLIKALGIYGAAWATTMGLVLFNIVKTWYLWHKMRMLPFGRESLLAVVFVAAAALVAWLVPDIGNVFADVAVRSAVFCLLAWYLLYKGEVSKELNGITDNLIYRKRLF